MPEGLILLELFDKFGILDLSSNLEEQRMPRINLSPETHRKLERLARPFKDGSEEDVIRRLADEALGEKAEHPPVAQAMLAGRDLVGHRGRRVQHGTVLKASYRGAQYQAEVRDGKVWWNGSSFPSLSAAAVALIRSTGSDRTTENGWRFWQRIPPRGEGSK